MNFNDPTGYDTECGLLGNDCGDYQDQLEARYEQDPSLEKNGISYEDFVKGYEAYDFYMSHPDVALQDCINDTDAYALADTFSDYSRHQLFQPFDEGAVYVMVEQARKSGDAKLVYSLLTWLAADLILQGPDKGFGGPAGSTYYIKGKLYSKSDLANALMIRQDIENVSSEDFADFIRSEGMSFRKNEWKKVMETWQFSNGTTVENHYWRHKSGLTYYHK